MLTPSTQSRQYLSPLNTHWHNRSLSSLSAISDAATFHSAHAHLSPMELRPMTQPNVDSVAPLPSPKLEAIKMTRQDSGFSEEKSQSRPSSRRTSTSSRSRRHSPSDSTSTRHRRKPTNSSAHSSRPTTRRNARFAAQTRNSNPGPRPNIQQRHTTPTCPQEYQFLQFPPLVAPEHSEPAPPPQPLPVTVQYWTSDSTRRLEYAAIDAASKGVKGFFIKLVPDCILPVEKRRTRFHGDGDDSDAGSVRRYRLVLPCEKEEEGEKVVRKGLLRRWTTALGKREI